MAGGLSDPLGLLEAPRGEGQSEALVLTDPDLVRLAVVVHFDGPVKEPRKSQGLNNMIREAGNIAGAPVVDHIVDDGGAGSRGQRLIIVLATARIDTDDADMVGEVMKTESDLAQSNATNVDIVALPREMYRRGPGRSGPQVSRSAFDPFA